MIENLSVRTLTKNDFGFCEKLSDTLGWGYSKQDFERLLFLEPHGCFIAEKDGKRIGMVTTIVYGKMAWTGWLVVLPEYRRRGIGTFITSHAINYLKGRAVETIRLNAGPISSLLYNKLGFKKELDILMLGSAGKRLEAKNVREIHKEDLPSVSFFDKMYFGASRERVLGKLYTDFPELSFVSCKNKTVYGYIMGMKNKFGIVVGPWVCCDDSVAEDLLRKMLSYGMEKKFYVSVPVINKKCIELLKNYGFKEYGKMFRMYLGKYKYLGKVDDIYAIGASELG